MKVSSSMEKYKSDKKIRSLMADGDKIINGHYEYSLIVLGKTGSGKSTLMNLMLNYENLYLSEDDSGNIIYCVNNITGTPSIGNKISSETSIPVKLVKFCDKLQTDVYYWDCPGFCDTNGPIQDIPNAYYIHNIFKKSTNVKLIVVVSDGEFFYSRSIDIQKLLKTLSNMFNSIDSIVNSLIFVINRAEPQRNIKHISTRLLKFMESDTFSQSEKKILQHLINNQKQIVLLPRPVSILDKMKNDLLNESVSQINFGVDILTNQTIDDESKMYVINLFDSSKKVFNDLFIKLCEESGKHNCSDVILDQIECFHENYETRINFITDLILSSNLLHQLSNPDLFSDIVYNYAHRYGNSISNITNHIDFYNKLSDCNLAEIEYTCKLELEILKSNIVNDKINFVKNSKKIIIDVIENLSNKICSRLIKIWNTLMNEFDLANFNKFYELSEFIEKCSNFKTNFDCISVYIDNTLIKSLIDNITLINKITDDYKIKTKIEKNIADKINDIATKIVEIDRKNSIIEGKICALIDEIFVSVCIIIKNSLDNDLIRHKTVIDKINYIVSNNTCIHDTFKEFILLTEYDIKKYEYCCDTIIKFTTITGSKFIFFENFVSKIKTFNETLISKYERLSKDIYIKTLSDTIKIFSDIKNIINSKSIDDNCRIFTKDFLENCVSKLCNDNVFDVILEIQQILDIDDLTEKNIYIVLHTNILKLKDYSNCDNYILKNEWQYMLISLINNFTFEGKQLNKITKCLKKMIKKLKKHFIDEKSNFNVAIENNKLFLDFLVYLKKILSIKSKPNHIHDLIINYNQPIIKNMCKINKLKTCNQSVDYYSTEFLRDIDYLTNDIEKNMYKLKNIQDNRYNFSHDLIKSIKFPQIQIRKSREEIVISCSFVTIKEIMKQVRPDIKNIILIVLHTLKIDQSVVLPGVNLIILSSIIEFTDNIEINLSGTNCKKNHNVLLKDDGSDGLPGYPGSNSGSLFMYAETIHNMDNVVFKVGGGQGGNGSNGSNGSDGSNGKDATKNFYKSDKLCEVNHGITKTNKSYNRIKTLYGFTGENGGNGGKGGAGGLGGHPGIVQVYQSTKKIKDLVGTTKNGKDGNPGKAGKGGKDGNHLICYVWNIHCVQHSEISKVNTHAAPGKIPKVTNSFGIENPGQMFDITNIVKSAIDEYNNFIEYAKKYKEHNRHYGSDLENFLSGIKKINQ